MKHTVLVSGGLDSTITMFYAERRFLPDHKVVPLHFILNSGYQVEEYQLVQELFSGDSLGVDDSFCRLSPIQGSSYIPNRNAHLVLGAAGRYRADEEGVIWLSVQRDETDLIDRSPEFFDAMNTLLLKMKYRVEVRSPWMQMDKTYMVQWALENGMQEGDLRRTFSCYSPVGGYKGCGDCPACFRRWVAFWHVGIDESSEHKEHPGRSTTAREYRDAALGNKYSIDRCDRILKSLGGLND